ncbi:hypothetical protein ATN84_10880 [Paramesorhizobium deserti]|uniref:Uncharacterized protein n=1 Tax=Paramesorhizobium deserti TaxID=1494590 RepID=A0A135HTN3_9HYPH|nr:hypothetical protein ATN84_10880 [Paramesorhizobium deserti]
MLPFVMANGATIVVNFPGRKSAQYWRTSYALANLSSLLWKRWREMILLEANLIPFTCFGKQIAVRTVLEPASFRHAGLPLSFLLQLFF